MQSRVRRASVRSIPGLVMALALSTLSLSPRASAGERVGSDAGPPSQKTPARISAQAPALPPTLTPVQTPTQTAMQSLFEDAALLLPMAMDEAPWSDPRRRIEIQAGLDRLAEAGALLQEHAVTRDLGFRALSRSLALDITGVRELYAQPDFEGSRSAMIEVTNTCAACHARLPGSPTSSPPQFPQAVMNGLSLHEQNQVWVATRNFDRAMAVWEAAFADEMQAPGHLDMEGYLLDYMTIGLRVRQNPARVRSTLASFARRPDMPIYLGRHLARWDLALAAIETDLTSAAVLPRARALAAAEDVPRPALLGREQTVYDLAASSLLFRFIEAGEGTPEQLSEAYYLLGVVEARSVDSYWLPQAESHLEAAIRLAPASPSAAAAYALLEEYVVVGFGGANGDGLPDDAWEKLRELAQRIEESPPPSPAENTPAP